jgi:hypothetical protein
MVLFDGDLRSAANGLADDADQLADMLSTSESGSAEEIAANGGFAEMVTLAGSVNSNARQAQRACGLPATGLFADQVTK